MYVAAVTSNDEMAECRELSTIKHTHTHTQYVPVFVSTRSRMPDLVAASWRILHESILGADFWRFHCKSQTRVKGEYKPIYTVVSHPHTLVLPPPIYLPIQHLPITALE